MSVVNENFKELCELVRETALLESTAALLEWDQQTQLPEAGHDYRSQQVTYLATLIHEKKTAPKLGELLANLSESDEFDDPNSSHVTTIRRTEKGL